MKIAIIVEGRTEWVFKPFLHSFLQSRLSGRMPKLDFVPEDGRLPKGEKLKRRVDSLLANGKPPADHVIALTDVYTGTKEFSDSADAKAKMIDWVGQNPRFHPHVALHDFEAWLLPYWDRIKALAGHNAKPPAGNPEKINHQNPPSERISDVFRRGRNRQHYSKVRDAPRILRGQDLMTAINACYELKAFVNTILKLSGANTIA